MKPETQSVPDMSFIRHQVSTILTVEKSIEESAPTDPSTAETLAKSNIKKLTDLLRYLDGLSGEREVV